ncbi:hypothetical protein HGRIS_007596 [Hohenbuehelia grisea]|uniref:Anti-proliferative protein domain-containing protein n=1 Tax=Hohenbuehelia grisea TaxID=104357 RepID=A0ABR3J5S8_9AGAR
MAASTISSTSLSVAVAHAISFLTRPLIISYSATTIIKLQLILEANLTAAFAPTWVPTEPLRGSGRRCLTLSPNCLPPRAIYAACLASGVQWFDWISLLGGREFDFFVDPGCVSMRVGKKGTPGSQMFTIWADEVPSPSAAKSFEQFQFTVPVQQLSPSKTIAQQILEEDKEEDDQIFAMIADEVAAPTWMSPILDQFPAPSRSDSPLSEHSRCSSRSSNSSSGFSMASVDSFGSYSSASSAASPVTPLSASSPLKQSRRERARQARVFVDVSKTEVTPYDGGKTTVLTGGVMLGGGATKAKKPTAPVNTLRPSIAINTNWRRL